MQAIQRLSDVYAKQKDAQALRKLLTELRPLFGVITKAKTAKIVRNIIETIAKVPDSTQLQVCAAPPTLSWHAHTLDVLCACQQPAGATQKAGQHQVCNVVQMEVCTEQVEWAKTEKRTFLRQRIEARLANLYLSMKDYSSALALISRLLTEASRASPCDSGLICCNAALQQLTYSTPSPRPGICHLLPSARQAQHRGFLQCAEWQWSSSGSPFKA